MWIKGTGSQPTLSFSFEEAIALDLGRRLLEPLSGTVFWGAARCAFQKVRAALGPNALDYLDRFARFFHHTMIGVNDYAAKAEPIDALVIAVEDPKAAQLLYRSERATEPASRESTPTA